MTDKYELQNFIPLTEGTVKPLPSDSELTDGRKVVVKSYQSNVSGEITNPPTEEKQDTAIDELQSILSELQTLRVVSAGNSTVVNLGIDEVFTGASFDTTPYSSGILTVYSDQSSAIDGLEIQSSNDGIDWTNAHTHGYTITGGQNRHFEFSLDRKFTRVVYTNGGVAQTAFSLQTVFNKTTNSQHIHSLDHDIDDSHPAQINRSVLTAKKPNGDYINIEATTGGNLKVAVEEYDDAVNPVRKNLEGVGDITIGVSEVEIAITGTPQSIRIQADNSNTGIIFIGKTGVLADGSNDFVRLNAGDEVIMSYDDTTNALYAISGTENQTINVGALL